MGLRPTKGDEDAQKHRSLTLAARKEGVTEPRPVRESVPLFYRA
jgi:hypothetical protein